MTEAASRVAADGERIEHLDAGGQRWLVSWHLPDVPPEGTGHGSAAVCFTNDGLVVLVTEGDGLWQLPGGRPEGSEDWRATLNREVLEEACSTVESATLLGFARSECIEGHQLETALVRAFWRALVALEPWDPRFEIRARLALTPTEACRRSLRGTLAPIYQRIFDEVLGGQSPT